MAVLTIGRLAQAGGVGVETVRYYQRRGLLRTPGRQSGSAASAGVRRYEAEDLRRLKFIRAAQTAGLTLEEISELLSLDAGHDHGRARALAQARIAALDARIEDLQRARTGLASLAAACDAEPTGPCSILAAFD